MARTTDVSAGSRTAPRTDLMQAIPAPPTVEAPDGAEQGALAATEALDTPPTPEQTALHGIETVERLKALLDSAALSSWALLYAAARGAAPAASTSRRGGLTAGELERLWDGLAWSATVEEVKVATGLGQRDCERRLAYAIAPARRTGTSRALLQHGEITLARALRVFDETALLDDEVADEVAAVALAPTPGGSTPSERLVIQRLRREVVRRRPPCDHDAAAALRARDAHATIHPEGTGDLNITGDACRVAGAVERVDTIARALAARGDTGRTLAQLRSDVALDLILYGVPADGHTLGSLPPATVHVVVPLTALLGESDGLGELPGHGYLTAAHAREAAIAPGSTWRRLVTDPLSGRARELSTHRYQPTPAMREYLQAVDRTCRAPGCLVSATRADLDHTTPWPHGATTPDNLAPTHRRHHNLKTAGLWHTTLDPETRTATWRTLTGRRYQTHPHDYRELDGSCVTHRRDRANRDAGHLGGGNNRGGGGNRRGGDQQQEKRPGGDDGPGSAPPF